MSAAHLPSRLGPTGLSYSNGKRPDGVTLVPWKSGRLLVWDDTCPDTFAPSHLPSATREAGAVAAQAEQSKQKYAALYQCHIFTPLAIETAGPFTPETFSFLRGLGCRLKQVTREAKSFFYLRQCLLTLSNGKCHCSDGNNGGHHLQHLFLFLTAFPSLGSSECFPFSYLTVFCLFMLLLFPVTVLKNDNSGYI